MSAFKPKTDEIDQPIPCPQPNTVALDGADGVASSEGRETQPPQIRPLSVQIDESSLMRSENRSTTAGVFRSHVAAPRPRLSALRRTQSNASVNVRERPLTRRSFFEDTSVWGRGSGRSVPRTSFVEDGNDSNPRRFDGTIDSESETNSTPRSPSVWRRFSVALKSEATHKDEDGRLWYDQFTSVDWIHDTVADSLRSRDVYMLGGLRGKLRAWLEATQGWLFAATIGVLTAFMAYIIIVSERAIYDLKFGHCSRGWLLSRRECCAVYDSLSCARWIPWNQTLQPTNRNHRSINFVVYIFFSVALAMMACFLTLRTRLATFRNFDSSWQENDLSARSDTRQSQEGFDPETHPPRVLYSAAGSGVAEVRVILSGFILHGFLGARTLILKSLGLVLSVASGLSIGKEGPLVHIATCVGNIVCRVSSKYSHNEAKLREMLSAAAASGVAVSFGAPIAGVLFSLEEVSYYFPAQTLFRTFLCCITAALSLKFLNPYGTGKIVIFQVDYARGWNYIGIVMFMILGAIGGATGALFIKASRLWARTFRRIPCIQESPMLEVFISTMISGLLSFWNRYTTLPVADLLLELTSPCDTPAEFGTGLCPLKEQIPSVIGYLLIAVAIKSFLTTITFGMKIPAGIYIPSMVVGGLLGRVVGHIVQYIALRYPNSLLFSHCSNDSNLEGCVIPGVYALLTASATMCGVTRLTITLVVMLFELTGNLDYVLPFSVAILVAKWTADAIEPLSIYDLLIRVNSYPFLDNKHRPTLTRMLGDITPLAREERVIEISSSPYVSSHSLRTKLAYLHSCGEIDGGLPILNNSVLVGLVAAPDLEFALDMIEDDDDQTSCLLSAGDGSVVQHDPLTPTDLRPYVDLAPVALDTHSPLELVYECFVRLGLRFICVTHGGKYSGMLHKKAFVKYVQELHERTG